MTTLLEILREARSRLGRAWDLLVTGEDPETAPLRHALDLVRDDNFQLIRKMGDLQRFKATVTAAVSNAP